jgi:hypothetical protein
MEIERLDQINKLNLDTACTFPYVKRLGRLNLICSLGEANRSDRKLEDEANSDKKGRWNRTQTPWLETKAS